MKVSESIFRDVLRLFVWFPLRWLILAIPIPWGVKVLSAMGDMHCLLSKGKKHLLMDNLSRVKHPELLGAENGENATKEYFRNHYVDRLSIFLFPNLNIREIEKLIEIEGIQHLDQALKKDNGVIIVHGHFGPVHIPLVVLARLGYRMKQIGLPSDEGLSWVGKNIAFKLRLKYESMMPAEVIIADSFLRPAFRWLKDNGLLMITGDGSGTERRLGAHEEFDFLGHRVKFPLGPAILSQKTSAVLIPMFIVPGEKKLYKIIIEAPLTSDHSGKEYASDLTGQFTRRLENVIAKYPGYWHFLDIFHHLTHKAD